MDRMKYLGKIETEKEVDLSPPFKLLGISNEIERNFGWVTPKNLFEEGSKPAEHKEGSISTSIEHVHCIYKKDKGCESSFMSS